MLVVLGVLALPAAPVSAQTWFAGTYLDLDSFAGANPAWDDWQVLRAVAVRDFSWGAIGIEATRQERFGLQDETFAVDVFAQLWPGAYGNLRGRIGPDAQVVPLSDWRLEVFQSLAGGWEVFGNAWLMNVPGPNPLVLGGGVGRYMAAWYLRAVGNVAEISGTRSGGLAFFGRRFFEDDGRQFVEFGAGLAGETVAVAPGPILEVRDTRFVSVTGQRFLAGPLGASFGLGLYDFEGVPFRRRVTAGLIARF